MKIDNTSLHLLATELKGLIRAYVSKETDSSALIDFLTKYDEKEANLLLTQFDRYGENLDYEKSGLRIIYTDGVPSLIAKKFGFKSEEDAKKGQGVEPSIFKLRSVHVGKDRQTRPWSNSITIPKTSALMSIFKIIIGKTIFNTTMDDMIIYNKVKKLKIIIESVSENGFTEKNVVNLQTVFEGEKPSVIDGILKLFDTQEQNVRFLGIRSIMYGDQLTFISIGKNFRQCEFSYNILHLRKTVDIVQKWKQLISTEIKA